jgi:hypothetical protein
MARLGGGSPPRGTSASRGSAYGPGSGAPAHVSAHPRGAWGPRGSGATGSARDPIARLLIDGRNVQRAMERGSSLPTAALVARIRAAFSPPTQIELILDGHAGGSPQGRVSPGLSVVFSRGRTADEIIGERAKEALDVLGPADAWSVAVVTDDREVRDHARWSGLRVEGTAWLIERIAGPRAQAAGSPTPAGTSRGAAIGNRPRR